MHRGYIDVADGVAVEFDPEAVPSIQWNHIDGPLLHMRSGQIHWLTLRERICVWLGCDNEFTLERKHAPEFVKRWLAKAQADFLKAREPMLRKRPVAFRVKNTIGTWVYYDDEDDAAAQGVDYQGLYVRDGT